MSPSALFICKVEQCLIDVVTAQRKRRWQRWQDGGLPSGVSWRKVWRQYFTAVSAQGCRRGNQFESSWQARHNYCRALRRIAARRQITVARGERRDTVTVLCQNIIIYGMPLHKITKTPSEQTSPATHLLAIAVTPSKLRVR